jgi:signal transduction histidine kinase
VAARRLTEEQLHQSQKMESVGQLTGGVAHDFNNLLMVVSANLELIEDAADNGRVRQFAAAARRAADRGTKLTAQLLAFSQRQVLNPKLVDANQLISEFQELIRQAVGGNCEVKLRTDERLWLCHVDPPLLETALLNLVLNGRDAMPHGGVLQIETRNIVLDEGAVAGCLPGSYVRLSVTDTVLISSAPATLVGAAPSPLAWQSGLQGPGLKFHAFGRGIIDYRRPCPLAICYCCNRFPGTGNIPVARLHNKYARIHIS